MYTPKGQKSLFSDYVREPKLYEAKFPTKKQQSINAFQGSVAMFDINPAFLSA
ncbi:MAG: hypothetical protein HGA42_12080 [Nostocales cyanobacterium W4_Combined_metabat2_030]|jgi:hypothetical protein|nr:hypothetical protein [Nostocales cyanobacterium W4_Combined_metabat2_030]